MKRETSASFELVAFLEGVSLLVLLSVAMPLKYLAGFSLAVRIVGLVHGLAFLAYTGNLLDALASGKWPWRTVLLGLLAGLLPAGTFLFVRRLRRLGLTPRAPML